jgi:hypothetical protein
LRRIKSGRIYDRSTCHGSVYIGRLVVEVVMAGTMMFGNGTTLGYVRTERDTVGASMETWFTLITQAAHINEGVQCGRRSSMTGFT